MKIVTTTCRHCRLPVHLEAGSVLLVVPTHPDEPGMAWFLCPHCEDLVGRAVPPVQVPELAEAGCQLVDADLAPYPEEHPGGPALDVDDLLDLHELLTDDQVVADALRELAA
jgi:hypothetical protein